MPKFWHEVLVKRYGFQKVTPSHIVELGNEIVHGQWSVEEVKHSSTWADFLSRIVDYDDWGWIHAFFK